MKRVIIGIVIFVSIVAVVLAKFWQVPSNSNKYDLDYILKDLAENEYKITDENLEMQGLVFPKGSYRVLYEDKGRKVATIQFINPDLADADYIVPIKKAYIKEIKKNEKDEYIEFQYNGRTYGPLDGNIITETNDYVLIQMKQPPPGLKVKYDFKFSFGELLSILQIIMIFIAIIFYYKESAREINIARRDIYQKLEFASIDLFKFEVQNAQDLWIVYDDTQHHKFPPKDTAEFWKLQEYVCQILNLFEMIVEFKNRGIIDTQVFLSWVRWFWDMCYSMNFALIWKEVDMNYTAPLRNAIDNGIDVAKQFWDLDEDDKYKKGYYEFLNVIGKEFKCTKDVEDFKRKEEDAATNAVK